MCLPELRIRRPVMTLVAGGVVLWAIIGSNRAASADEGPRVTVTVTYPGASADTMASLAAPLERQLATIAGVASVSSANVSGHSAITVEFEQRWTIDAAAPDLQSAISAASASLPPDLPALAHRGRGPGRR
jgi:HAE1 family hydrophobic/amphiphilic exporter-1